MNKKWLKQDYNIRRAYSLHAEGRKAIDFLEKHFKGAYYGYELVNIAFQNLARIVKEKGIKPNQDLEKELEI